MIVNVRLKNLSQPIKYVGVDSTYEKCSFYCIKTNDFVVKYLIQDIFDIKESY